MEQKRELQFTYKAPLYLAGVMLLWQGILEIYQLINITSVLGIEFIFQGTLFYNSFPYLVSLFVVGISVFFLPKKNPKIFHVLFIVLVCSSIINTLKPISLIVGTSVNPFLASEIFVVFCLIISLLAYILSSYIHINFLYAAIPAAYLAFIVLNGAKYIDFLSMVDYMDIDSIGYYIGFVQTLLTFFPIVLLLISLAPSRTDEEEKQLVFEETNIVRSVLLYIFSLGLYFYRWGERMCKKIRLLNGESANCTGEVLCLMFVPIYPIYWIYTRSKKITQSAQNAGFRVEDKSIINMVLSLFGLSIVSYVFMEQDLNTIAKGLSGKAVPQTAPAYGVPSGSAYSVSSSPSYSAPEQTNSYIPVRVDDVPQQENITEKLTQLKTLYDSGVLTEEEYTAKKEELLSRM